MVRDGLTPGSLGIALAHLAAVPGDVGHNRTLVEAAVVTAARAGAAWIVTPELCISGYTFADQIGTDWILEQPDPWMSELCRLAARLRVTLFLSHPERDGGTGKLHNTVFVIGADGAILGKHRKVNTLRVGSESWSSPGERVAPIPVPPFTAVGVLICADAYSPGIARSLKDQGAEVLVSAAAWAPGFHGPDGEWERCTSETGLPLVVCNRTGRDRTWNFTGAESVVAKEGERLLSCRADGSAIFTIEWNVTTCTLACPGYRTTYL